MQQADVAVSAGGQTLNELARVGVPTVMLGVAENQRRAVGSYQGLMECAGWWNEADWPQRLAAGLGVLKDPEIRAKRALELRRIFDGQGSHRIAKALLSTFS
jgi:spore coat polysaccharide biosynthesis predicted glycosyltransferase SpsG